MSTPFRRNWIMREEPPWMGFDVVFAQSLGPVWLSLSPELYSPPASSVCGISQARILERIPFSRESSQPRDQTWVSCNCRQVVYHWDTREVHEWDECSYKRPQRALQSSFCHVRTQWEVSSLQPERTWPCWYLDLGLPASRTERNSIDFCGL